MAVPSGEPSGADVTETDVTVGVEASTVSDHYVYVLRCADDTLYTGYTTDVARRVREHDAGEGAKYTRGRTPVELVHVERFETRSAAMAREHEVKSLARGEKEALIDEEAPVDADRSPDADDQ